MEKLKGRHNSPATEFKKGRKESPATREKRLKALRSEETKRKVRETFKQKKVGFQKGYTPYNKDKKMPKEYCEKVGEALAGHKVSEETCKKLRQALKGNKNGWQEGGKIIKKICLICNTEFAELEIKRHKFCSKKCYRIFLKNRYRGKNNPAWKGGVSFEPYSFEFNKELKEAIRQRDNYKCQLCGVPQIECLQTLNVHHLDYNKKNCEPSNLITLCHKCNMIVNFNREYWQSYFQQGVLK